VRGVAGKRAIVTGAGSGIGRAIATRLVDEGATVLVVDVSGAEAGVAEELGPAAVAQRADVSVEADVRAMVERSRAEWGRLDILVNGAAGAATVGRGPLVDVDPDDLRRTLDGVLVSAFLGMKHAIPLMIGGGGGSIVNIASLSALVAWPGMGSYAAGKAGMLALTRAAAVENARQGIRVNAISMGTVASPPVLRMPEEQQEQAASLHPIGRLGRPDEIAALAVFLASDECGFATGANFVADGGRTASAGHPGDGDDASGR